MKTRINHQTTTWWPKVFVVVLFWFLYPVLCSSWTWHFRTRLTPHKTIVKSDELSCILFPRQLALTCLETPRVDRLDKNCSTEILSDTVHECGVSLSLSPYIQYVLERSWSACVIHSLLYFKSGKRKILETEKDWRLAKIKLKIAIWLEILVKSWWKVTDKALWVKVVKHINIRIQLYMVDVDTKALFASWS